MLDARVTRKVDQTFNSFVGHDLYPHSAFLAIVLPFSRDYIISNFCRTVSSWHRDLRSAHSVCRLLISRPWCGEDFGVSVVSCCTASARICPIDRQNICCYWKTESTARVPLFEGGEEIPKAKVVKEVLARTRSPLQSDTTLSESTSMTCCSPLILSKSSAELFFMRSFLPL